MMIPMHSIDCYYNSNSMITIFWTTTIIALVSLTSCYSTVISMVTSTSASISNYYQDFASCSCDLTPSLCDNYCCCDSLCTSASSWSSSNQCLATSSSIEVPCGQSTSGYGAIQDLACVYFSNRGTIGYYYQSPSTTSTSSQTSNLFSTVSTPSSANSAQASVLNSLSLGSAYTATNQYLKTSSSSYLFVPLPGIGGTCTPGLVNFTTSGTFTCKITPTTQNCGSLNSAYGTSLSVCSNSNCSSSSNTVSIPSSNPVSGVCQNVLTGLTISATLVYSGGFYALQNVVVSTPTTAPITLNTLTTVSVTISISTSTPKSGNPGYLQGKAITMSGGIANILDTLTGICSTSSSGSAISIPFNVKKTVSCSSPTPCTSNYYIDTLSNLSLTINKYAAQSSDVITVINNFTPNCSTTESYTLTILYSLDGWLMDPQYYIVSASLSATATPDNTAATTKYLQIDWIYVDPSTVSAPPQNTFYTYFSYLWTPLKQKFGMS